MNKYQQTRQILQNMSKAGVSDSTIARLSMVSVEVIRKILFFPQYRPTERILGKIQENLNKFKKDLDI